MVDFVIFAATQRTGSTLVQRLFNTNPHTMIWGEAGQALVKVLGMQAQAMKFSDASRGYRDSWLKDRDPAQDISCLAPAPRFVHAATVAAARAFVDGLYPPQDGIRTGFKEVNLPPQLVDILQAAFPAMQPVFLTRHPADAWRSTPTDWPISLNQFLHTWKRNTEGYAERGRLLWLEDVIRDPDTRAYLAGLAGISPDDYNKTLNINVNSTPSSNPRPVDEQMHVAQECRHLTPDHIHDRWLAKRKR